MPARFRPILLVTSLVFLVDNTVQAANIALVKLQDLSFPNGAQGDSSTVVSPGSANSAKYTVTGNPGATYSVTLPSSVSMAGPGTAISATTFTSSSTNSYTLNVSGQDTLYIGATRAALPLGQSAGAYSKLFQPTVRYTTGGKTANSFTNCQQTVYATISISNVSGLSFPQAAASDGAYILSATGTGHASFTVSGSANAAFSISLPADGTISMATAGGGTADKLINVGSFTSSPSGSGTIGAGGSTTIGVGATRSAIRATQQSGNYTTTFQVTVTYQ